MSYLSGMCISQVLDRTKDVIVIEVDQGLRFPGNDHLKQTILDEALDGKCQDDHSHTHYSVFSRYLPHMVKGERVESIRRFDCLK